MAEKEENTALTVNENLSPVNTQKDETPVPEAVAVEVQKAFPIYGHEAVKHVNAIRESYSILQRIAILIFSAAIIYGVYIFFPRTEPLSGETTPVAPEDDTKAISKKSPEYELYEKSLALYENGKYIECATLLDTKMEQIILNRKNDSNDKLFYLYFDSILRGGTPHEKLAASSKKTPLPRSWKSSRRS